MNQIDSFFERNKENILSKENNAHSKDYFSHQNSRVPLQDITFMYTKTDKTNAFEEKYVKKICSNELKIPTRISLKTKCLSSKHIR